MPGKIVSEEEWIVARKALLKKEKELSRTADQVAAQLREMPMVRLNKEYKFHGPNSATLSLLDLFAGKDQLIVYHFMFGPDSETGCKGCAFLAEHIPDLRHIRSRNTSMVCISRAPFEKLEAWKNKMGWNFPWYSSEGSDFNYDFHATFDDNVKPILYNYKTKEELVASGNTGEVTGDQPGMSVFLKQGGEIYHTYSSYARGLDFMMNTLQLLDLTPLGRQDGPYGPASYKLNYEYEDDA